MAVAAKGDGDDPTNREGRGAAKPKSDATLDRVIQGQIGDRLRSMYGELSDQPVPDRLVALLDQLGVPKDR